MVESMDDTMDYSLGLKWVISTATIQAMESVRDTEWSTSKLKQYDPKDMHGRRLHCIALEVCTEVVALSLRASTSLIANWEKFTVVRIYISGRSIHICKGYFSDDVGEGRWRKPVRAFYLFWAGSILVWWIQSIYRTAC